MGVGHVRVRVGERLVDVGIGMRLSRWGELRVLVPMVLVVDMGVVVPEALVGMDLGMPLDEDQEDARRHASGSCKLAEPEWLSQQRNRDDRAHEGSRGEKRGLPRRNQGTQRVHRKDDAHP